MAYMLSYPLKVKLPDTCLITLEKSLKKLKHLKSPIESLQRRNA